MITLQPEATERGLSYAAVMAKARGAVNLGQLGIDGLRVRSAVTGARLLELPRSASAASADSLAEKLREVFPEGEVRVTRPFKSAELRITGLDDSISGQDVQEAISKKTGCPSDAVKVGAVRLGPGGVGSIWVQAPASSAKALAAAGRLLVGWSSARVQTLEARPIRCFKCLGNGHTRLRCPSTADYGNLCFRCGKPDHQASKCEAEPHCPRCDVAKLPANHVVGSKSCRAPNPRKVRERPSQASSGKDRPQRSETVPMSD